MQSRESGALHRSVLDSTVRLIFLANLTGARRHQIKASFVLPWIRFDNSYKLKTLQDLSGTRRRL